MVTTARSETILVFTAPPLVIAIPTIRQGLCSPTNWTLHSQSDTLLCILNNSASNWLEALDSR
jgi:hypothetical protein